MSTSLDIAGISSVMSFLSMAMITRRTVTIRKGMIASSGQIKSLEINPGADHIVLITFTSDRKVLMDIEHMDGVCIK